MHMDPCHVVYTCTQGVKAVIAESFERIHRSNLVGMGILPLQYLEGTSNDTLGLTGIIIVYDVYIHAWYMYMYMYIVHVYYADIVYRV